MKFMKESKLANTIGTWLAWGECGASSMMLAVTLLGGTLPIMPPYPHDPADLKRCLDLLDRVKEDTGVDYTPEVLAELAAHSAAWNLLAQHWCDLHDTCRSEEKRPDNTAPETYKMMRELIDNWLNAPTV